jgi:hypothetical protein
MQIVEGEKVTVRIQLTLVAAFFSSFFVAAFFSSFFVAAFVAAFIAAFFFTLRTGIVPSAPAR